MPNTLFQAHAGSGKSQFLHHIAWLWANNDISLNSFHLLFLIRGGDIVDTLDNSIKDIIGEKNMQTYENLRSKMRILILLDAFDEIATKATNDVHFLANMIKRRQANITFVMSTRRHKTDEIMSGGHNEPIWKVVRCNGVRSESVELFFATQTNQESASRIRDGLKENNLHHNPLFILMAYQIYSTEKFHADINLDMYTLLSRFCDGQLNRL